MLAGWRGWFQLARGKRDCAPAKEPLVWSWTAPLTASYFILHSTSSLGIFCCKAQRLFLFTPYSLYHYLHTVHRA